MLETFEYEVSYSQIAVFDGRLDLPFNDWTPRHYEQGFSWRPGSVSFRTLIESGSLQVTVRVTERHEPIEKAAMAISVPFHCSREAQLEVASPAGASRRIALPAGDHQLVYEAIPSPDEGGIDQVVLSFVEGGDLTPQVLTPAPGSRPEYPLLMEAEPAR